MQMAAAAAGAGANAKPASASDGAHTKEQEPHFSNAYHLARCIRIYQADLTTIPGVPWDVDAFESNLGDARGNVERDGMRLRFEAIPVGRCFVELNTQVKSIEDDRKTVRAMFGGIPIFAEVRILPFNIVASFEALPGLAIRPSTEWWRLQSKSQMAMFSYDTEKKQQTIVVLRDRISAIGFTSLHVMYAKLEELYREKLHDALSAS